MAKGTRFMSNMKLEHSSELSFIIVLILKAFKLRSTWKKSGGKRGVAPSDFYCIALKCISSYHLAPLGLKEGFHSANIFLS